MGSADSKEEQNFPASQRLSNNFCTQPDSRRWRLLQLAPSCPRTTRGLLRQKESVLIPQAGRALENRSMALRLVRGLVSGQPCLTVLMFTAHIGGHPSHHRYHGLEQLSKQCSGLWH